MNIRRKRIAQALLQAFGAGVALSLMATPVVFAQEAPKPAEKSNKIDKIEVTGSNIKRVAVEGPSPVSIVTREEIDKTGAETVSEVLRSMSENNGGAFDESFTNSFSKGSSGVSLRGLGQDATLVLLNGRRLANYGFAQNLSDAFVDLNSIPLGAVERIEVLKDGASAIYGSDAIAGVINIITRKNYTGLEGTVSYGTTDKGDGQEKKVTVSGGMGDLNKDGYNLLLTGDYFKREPIFARDRGFSKNSDFRNKGGEGNGYDLRTTAGSPGNYRTTTSSRYIAFADCPADRIGTTNDDFPGRCYTNTADYLLLAPETERLGGMALLNYQINSDLTLFSELSLTHNTTNANSTPTGVTNRRVSATAPGNPYGQDVFVRFWFADAGPRTQEVETDASRVLVGLKGNFKDWDWESALGYSRSETTETGNNYFRNDMIDAALLNGTYNPFIISSTGNSAAAIDAAGRVSLTRHAESELQSFDFKASTELTQLKYGPLGLATGLDVRHESLTDTPDPLSTQTYIFTNPNGSTTPTTLIASTGGTGSSGDRNLASVFGELNIPLYTNLEVQLAARYDKYSDFGDTTNPKIAVRFQPAKNLLLRASAGTAFRAPSLVQLYMGQTVAFQGLVDTARCDLTGRSSDCGGSTYHTNFTGNTTLRPETARNYNVGFVYEPIPSFSIGVDYYKINQKDKIAINTQYLLDNEASFPGAVVRNPQTPEEAAAGIPGTIAYINDQFRNFAQQIARGFDVELTYRFQFEGVGKFTLSSIISRLESFKKSYTPDSATIEIAGTMDAANAYAYPKNRSVTTLAWERGDFETSLTANYISSYRNDAAFNQVTGGNDMVQSDLTFDAQVVYNGIKKSKITFGIKNLTDEEPPFVAGGSFPTGYDFGTSNGRGRFIYARYNYKFR